MKHFIKENTWLNSLPTGWGNGYVVIPQGHPMYGIDYDEIPVEVHGGLTFASSVHDCINWPEVKDMFEEGGWVVGFDTAHFYDNKHTCPESYVLAETLRLKEQLEAMA
jgi:hypothetical protein